MPSPALDPHLRSAPFRRFGSLQRLTPDRSGHASVEHVRHQLYVGRDTQTRANGLVKLTTKPGIVYEQNLLNEIATLTTINRELQDSHYFPLLWDHGRLRDGRVFVIMSLFDEWPLATTIGPERMPHRLMGYLRMALEVAAALTGLHRIGTFHVDLNPMNILYRAEQGRPVIRIIDFESSYEVARHGKGDVYNPATTPGFAAPEVPARPPDARTDVYSLGAVIYTTIAGYGWTFGSALKPAIEADRAIDDDLRAVLLNAVDADPDRRYQSMAEMSAALTGYLSG